jgi:hypothetical protein
MKDWINILEQKSSEGREIKESEIIINIPPELHNDWDDFMRGKTCPILDDGDYGVFSWDLINFLNKFNDQ